MAYILFILFRALRQISAFPGIGAPLGQAPPQILFSLSSFLYGRLSAY